MSREMSFFIYLLERFAEFRGETADYTLKLLREKGLYDYAINMYELYHTENIENAFQDLNQRLTCNKT